jgi:hypothetical protein
MTGREAQVSRALDGVAKRHGVPISSVAIAYVMHKAPHVFPVLGGRKIAHLKANIEALSLRLSPQDIEDVEKGYDFDIGFPHDCINMAKTAPQGPQDATILTSLGYFDYTQGPQPIKPHQGELGAAWQP